MSLVHPNGSARPWVPWCGYSVLTSAECVFKSIDSRARGYGPSSKSVTLWVNSNNNDVFNNNLGLMIKELG